MSNVNIKTTIVRHGKSKVKHLDDTPYLGVVQHAMTTMLSDLTNAGEQVAAGIAPPQTGPYDKTMTLRMDVTHMDGTPHHYVEVGYQNFSQSGIDVVMKKVGHHLDPLGFK